MVDLVGQIQTNQMLSNRAGPQLDKIGIFQNQFESERNIHVQFKQYNPSDMKIFSICKSDEMSHIQMDPINDPTKKKEKVC